MTAYEYHYKAVVSNAQGDEDVRAALEARKARKVGEIPREESQLREEVWELPSGDRVRIIWDHFVDILSLRAESKVSGMPAEVIHELRAHLKLEEIDALVRQATDKDPARRSHAVRGLASIAEKYYSDIVDVIKKALADRDSALRAAAMRSIARWPHFAFVEALEKRAKTEKDEALRAEAAQLAKDVKKYGRRGT